MDRMRITEIETWILKAPLDGQGCFWSSQASFTGRKSLLLRIGTDAGVSGWGECGQYGPAEPTATAIHSVFAPMLLGHDGRTPEVHWERMFSAVQDFGRAGAAMEAISGIDIALWDALGRSLKTPIATLLGGRFRSSVQVYATGLYYSGAALPSLSTELPSIEREAGDYARRGFPAVKMKVGLLRPEEDLERIALARRTLGDRCLLMVDANHAYQAHVAARLARAMEPHNIFWFEEPVPPEDIEGYLQVKAATSIAIAGGECEHTRFGFLPWFERRAFDIAQPDPSCAGGLSETRRIAALASAFHIACLPHVWGTGVALAAGLQFLATLAPSPHTAQPVAPYNEPVLEWDSSANPLRMAVLQTPLTMEEGRVRVPDGPGLGVEVNPRGFEPFVHQHLISTVYASSASPASP